MITFTPQMKHVAAALLYTAGCILIFGTGFGFLFNIGLFLLIAGAHKPGK